MVIVQTVSMLNDLESYFVFAYNMNFSSLNTLKVNLKSVHK